MKKLYYLLILVIFVNITTVHAKSISYWQVHRMPQSVEKDYYIWRFLSQPTTTVFQAKDIITEVNSLNKKLRTAYKNKTGFNAPVPSNSPVGSSKAVKNWRKRSEANGYFKNGIFLLEQNQLQKAADAFYEAHNKYEDRWEKDKCLFWLYMVTKDKEYLDKLKKSYHINLYTLLAADFTKSRYPRSIVVPKLFKRNLYGIDAKDPIFWAKMKRRMYKSANFDDLADECESQETVGMYCFFKAKACNYKKSYFPMPYRNIMKKYPKKRQALIYAIARQESRFIPASVSRSFALGMMQFMPFLIEHIARKKGERIDLDDIFKPKKAIEYADYHLNYLQKYLYHPLFVAYAYNGGIGFTKRLIRQNHYFRKGSYEPYLSMEKMTNIQAREYGKRVLTNYIVYLNKLGKPTRLLPFIQMLTNPSKTDTFRR